MGCCNSKSTHDIDQNAFPNANISIISSNRSTDRNMSMQQSAPPIIITKAQSVNSIDSFIDPCASINNQIVMDSDEKPQVLIKEQSQEHGYGEPPSLEELKESIEYKNIKEEAGILPWSILIRLSNSNKDIVVQIPISEPYMKISDLKLKIQIEPKKKVKFFHLGRLLDDNYKLVPSTSSLSATNYVKVLDQGVIQAMVY